MGTPLATFLFVATALGDLVYPFVFYHVERIETGAPIPLHDPILYLAELILDPRAHVWSFIESHPLEIVGLVFVAITWCMLKTILWRLDHVSRLLEAQSLRKMGNLDEVQKARKGPLGTWVEKSVDSGELKEGRNQTIVRHTVKPRIVEVKRRSAEIDVKVDDRAVTV